MSEDQIDPFLNTMRSRPSIETLKAKEYIEVVTVERTFNLQDRIIEFLLKAYGCLLAATMLIFFLQGFHLFGFKLEEKFINWIGGATVGQIAGLLTLSIGAVFKRRGR